MKTHAVRSGARTIRELHLRSGCHYTERVNLSRKLAFPQIDNATLDEAYGPPWRGPPTQNGTGS